MKMVRGDTRVRRFSYGCVDLHRNKGSSHNSATAAKSRTKAMPLLRGTRTSFATAVDTRWFCASPSTSRNSLPEMPEVDLPRLMNGWHRLLTLLAEHWKAPDGNMGYFFHR